MQKLKIVAITFTNQCNLQCVHCGHKIGENYREELPASFFLNVLEQAAELGADYVNITGGEIFCRKDCFELIEGAFALGYSIGIESNGTLIKEEQIKRLSAYGEKIRISISLDGITSDVHDSIRGQGAFEKTISNIRLLSEYHVPTRVITVLNKNNLEQIPELVTYIVDDLGLGFRLIPNIMEYGRGVYACNVFGVNYCDIKKLLEEFYFDFLRIRDSDKMSIELNVALVPTDIDYHNQCQWGTAMIGLNPYGLASFCHVSGSDDNFTLGDLRTDSLKDIWNNSELLNKFRNMDLNLLKGICGNCLAREYCRGGCRLHAIAKYGDFFAPDPQCQSVYDAGYFPEYAIEEKERECIYEG